MWRKKILPFFLFNRKERRGIYILLVIITGMWMIPGYFSSPVTPISVDELILIEQARDTLLARGKSTGQFSKKYGTELDTENGTGNGSVKYNARFTPKSLFIFDPNTASAADWQKLGLPGKTIATLQKYLSKGGRIRKPEDLQKIYGFPEEAYEKLHSFVRIKENEASDKINAAYKFQDKPQYTRKPTEIQRVFINSADSIQWEALPGIGPKLASRIILFRKRLGGFSSIRQVAETYGLPDSTFQKIMPYLEADNLTSPITLDINNASQEELQAHPYLSYQLAKSIIAYRNQHGPFTQKDELRKLALMTPELFNKIAPYISTR
jgi:DNA uptake protein ComE-like DNA-binding protein